MYASATERSVTSGCAACHAAPASGPAKNCTIGVAVFPPLIIALSDPDASAHDHVNGFPTAPTDDVPSS